MVSTSEERLRHLRHQLEQGQVGDRAKASSKRWGRCGARHLHDWERQPRRAGGGTEVRMRRLSHQACFGEIADRAIEESIGVWFT